MWRVGSTYRVLSCGVSQCRERPPPPIRGVRADPRSRSSTIARGRRPWSRSRTGPPPPAYHINDCNLYANIASHGVANDVL